MSANVMFSIALGAIMLVITFSASRPQRLMKTSVILKSCCGDYVSTTQCRRAPSPVDVVESCSDVDLNVSLAKKSFEKTSFLPLRRSDRLRNEKQQEHGDYVF